MTLLFSASALLISVTTLMFSALALLINVMVFLFNALALLYCIVPTYLLYHVPVIHSYWSMQTNIYMKST